MARAQKYISLVRGTHQNETAAFALAVPIAELLRKSGFNVSIRDVPMEAADWREMDPKYYRKKRKVRAAWWRGLVEEGGMVFSLHNYPYMRSEQFKRHEGCIEIGALPYAAKFYGIYLFPENPLHNRSQDPMDTLDILFALWLKATSRWEDRTLLHASMIEIPAVPDQGDPRGLRLHLHATEQAGFSGIIAAHTIASGIERLLSPRR